MKVETMAIGCVNDGWLQYAVLGARFQGKWIFVRHRERDTWEMPGGRREPNEDIFDTAARELFEETGATAFQLVPVGDYAVIVEGGATYGRLYYAEIEALGDLPEMEIGEVQFFDEMPHPLTYPQIQSLLHDWVCTFAQEQSK